jgi:hypothetical protein
MTAHTPVTSATQKGDVARRKNYDMDDDANDFVKWPDLQILLQVLKSDLLPMYSAADVSAKRRQTLHSWLVGLAAVFGTIAVLCAIFELAEIFPDQADSVEIAEIVAAGAAIVLVVLGICSSFHKTWLSNRFIAEQCRFIKFHLLLDPAFWYGQTESAIRSTVANLLQPLRIKNKQFLGKDGLIHQWVTWKSKITDRYVPISNPLPVEVANQLIDYYKDKRLDYQHHYFEDQAKKRGWRETATKYIPPWCFFLSIVAAFVHFVIEKKHLDDVHIVARYSLLLAAALPAFAAGVRTVRAAHEFGRNHLRFEAKENYLHNILGDPAVQTAAGQPPSADAIPLLREAEGALDAEHRAWLRLMIESEWFG